ncbi:MAG: DUF4325 domain-containing protein [Methyloprofundus sp.]|nr:DUF4325 domain-containing protein [Methyloprofundus sp.]
MKMIDIGKDFSRYPAGRFTTDGPHNGELFRNSILIPALNDEQQFTIELDDTAGYGSSFLEESFGGLIRQGISLEKIKKLMTLHSDDESLIEEINDYMDEAESE